jgi:hypothetical protein
MKVFVTYEISPEVLNILNKEEKIQLNKNIKENTFIMLKAFGDNVLTNISVKTDFIDENDLGQEVPEVIPEEKHINMGSFLRSQIPVRQIHPDQIQEI